MDDTATISRSRPTDPLSGLPLRRPDPAPALTPQQHEARRDQQNLTRFTQASLNVPQAPTPEQLLMRSVDSLQRCPPLHVCRHLGMTLQLECDRARFLVDPEHATLKNAGRVVMRLAQEARPDVVVHIRALLDGAEDVRPIEEAIRIIDRFSANTDRIRQRDAFQAFARETGVPALCAEHVFIEHAPQDVRRRLEWRRDRLRRLAETRLKAVEHVRTKLADGSKAIGGPDGLADALVLARRLRGVPTLAGDQRAQLATASDRLAQTERDLASIEGYEAPPELVDGLKDTAETLRVRVADLKDEIKRVELADALATATAAFSGDLPSFTAVLAEIGAMPGAFPQAARQAIAAADWFPSLGLDALVDGAETDEGLQYTPRG